MLVNPPSIHLGGVVTSGLWWDELTGPFRATVELGGFGQFTWFDDNAGRTGAVEALPKDGFGYGGRVGVFISPRWQLEGDAYYSPQETDTAGVLCCPGTPPTEANASAFALRVNYNFPLRKPMGLQTHLIIGVGGVITNYKIVGGTGAGSVGATSIYNHGASGLAGLRIGVASRTAIRVDGVIDYMPDHQPDANMNLHGRAGLSFLLGGVRPEAMCTYAGLETIPASSADCVAPLPLPPPPPLPSPLPAQVCRYDASILATDPRCAAPARIATVDTAAITAPIYFDFDKLTIRPDAAAILDRKIPWLRANPGLRIRIEGNADERGSDEYNLALGQRRAVSARQYLVERGIAADRFDVASYGEERPVCAEHNAACWQQNRRVDFRIVTLGRDGMIRTP
jgi:peptidoglycan-associated lipoprotein